ncbi:hypothetical protein PHK61_09440 [Actinomycetospora lutea]|uniref:hypothetical protein n=1 Tax=Actinomycetospora lutea TaxID=663604 RepID=UPI002365DEB7|nr:hypothetical protein [Actinomycetospora lutea]MDD7938638.1 hypothetical protein [Actinomycetospora lutea]
MGRRRDDARVLRETARGALGGAVGTGAMALAAHLRRRRFTRRHGITPEDAGVVLDYDDSEHVVIAAATLTRHVVGWSPRSSQERTALFWLVHWGYGSAVGAAHVVLQRVLRREPAAGLAFFTASQVMALGLFPVLGETPPPWHWERRLVVTSFVQHAIYAGVVAAANAATASPTLTARLGRRRG